MISAILYALPFLGAGLQVTLLASSITVFVSLVLGVVLGAALVYGPRPVRWAVRGLSDVVRGIPLLVLIFFVYYGLPAAGINLPPFAAAVAALTVFKTAQVIENVRGALGSIPMGQMDAAKAIGLGFLGRLRYVIAPQAVRRFLPPWINGVTDAVKGSALISLLGITDLMQALQQVIGRTYEAMPLYVLGAAIYIAINAALSAGSRVLERQFERVRA